MDTKFFAKFLAVHSTQGDRDVVFQIPLKLDPPSDPGHLGKRWEPNAPSYLRPDARAPPPRAPTPSDPLEGPTSGSGSPPQLVGAAPRHTPTPTTHHSRSASGMI